MAEVSRVDFVVQCPNCKKADSRPLFHTGVLFPQDIFGIFRCSKCGGQYKVVLNAVAPKGEV